VLQIHALIGCFSRSTWSDHADLHLGANRFIASSMFSTCANTCSGHCQSVKFVASLGSPPVLMVTEITAMSECVLHMACTCVSESSDLSWTCYTLNRVDPGTHKYRTVQLSSTAMKIDIHSHILPESWPDLKEVGTSNVYLTLRDRYLQVTSCL
jgi:hypothetical protein